MNPRFLWVLFPIYLSISLPIDAQVANSSESFTIAGHVMNMVTGQPIQRALVVAQGSPHFEQREVHLPIPLQVLTDAAGNFRFQNVRAGTYQITVRKPQYEADRSQGPVPITIGPSRTDIELRLSPL